MLKFYPAVRIHVWGGLGSQLFAIALAEDLKASFPKRKLRIVLHTGGVTRRLPEVTELFPYFNFTYQEDFTTSETNSIEKSTLPRDCIKRMIKYILFLLGFLGNCNDSTEKIHPWVLSIRGHYSNRAIKTNFLRDVAGRLLSVSKIKISQFDDACTMHYRLGDLLTLQEKNPIEAPRLSALYSSKKLLLVLRKLTVFSDSPLEAYNLLKPHIQEVFQILDLPTTDVIAGAISSKYFIGTSSKVSFWIAGIRATINGNRSALPRENKTQYASLVGIHTSLIDEY